MKKHGPKYSGVYTAIITPLKPSGQLDLPAFKRILKDQKRAGVAGVVVCGTTGESPTLSDEEKQLLIQVALDELDGSKTQVIAGTGSNDTESTIEFSTWASDNGVAAVLVVTPYYNKPSQEGLISHFTSVADAIECDLILYNVPGRTGVSLTASTIAKLADHPRIRGLKEATGNLAFASEIRDQLLLRDRYLDLLSGDDATYLPLLSLGATGVISVASNLFPKPMMEMHNAFISGKVSKARALQERYYPLYRDLFVESNPVPIKAAMNYAGYCDPTVRAPLVALTSGSLKTLRVSLKSCGIRSRARSKA